MPGSSKWCLSLRFPQTKSRIQLFSPQHVTHAMRITWLFFRWHEKYLETSTYYKAPHYVVFSITLLPRPPQTQEFLSTPYFFTLILCSSLNGSYQNRLCQKISHYFTIWFHFIIFLAQYRLSWHSDTQFCIYGLHLSVRINSDYVHKYDQTATFCWRPMSPKG